MTAKEKANELVEKFKGFVNGYIGSSMLTNDEYPERILTKAKKIAIIVVDEILQEVHYGQRCDWIKERQGGEEFTSYWKSVKQEIELLELL